VWRGRWGKVGGGEKGKEREGTKIEKEKVRGKKRKWNKTALCKLKFQQKGKQRQVKKIKECILFKFLSF
jgi:hypothetical protein